MISRRVSRDDGFGRSSRFYRIGAHEYPSVTTVLQCINKPALLNWAAKVEREAVLAAVGELYADMPADKPYPRSEFLALVSDRLKGTRAHEKEKIKAGDIGSAVHARIEWEFKREGPEPVLSDQGLWAYMAWEDWRKSAELEIERTEETVWSDTYCFAGTMDWLGTITHEGQRIRVLGDYKTGRALYPEASLQIAAYIEAIQERGNERDLSGCLVRLPKQFGDPAFEVRVIPVSQLDDLFSAFLSVLKLWRWLEAQ